MATVQEVRVKAGYEEIHNMAVAKLNSLEEAIKREIEEKLAKDKNALLGIIRECEEVVEVEVEEPKLDEVQPEEVVNSEGYQEEQPEQTF